MITNKQYIHIGTIHIGRENIKQSIIKDAFMFFILISSFYLNYKFIDGNNFVDVLLIIAFIGLDIRVFNYHKYYHKVSEMKIKQIEKILEKK